MRKILLKFVPESIILFLKRPSFFLSGYLKDKPFLTKIYYLIFSRAFNQEMRAIFYGIAEYKKSLHKSKNSSYLLRRNIHRIEKGLVMIPRRITFAEAYIMETVKIFVYTSNFEEFNKNEKYRTS